jgi:hypothetical protein
VQARKKYFIKQMSLACVYKEKLLVSLFNKKLLRVNFGMSKESRVIFKKRFISLVDLDGISGLELSSTIPIGIFARG